MTRKNSVVFYRNFRGFSGGHLKVWHYFNHVAASTSHAPQVFFTERSVWDTTNPWYKCDDAAIAESWAPENADVLFIGGTDWEALPSGIRRAEKIPIINIIQGLSHTDPGEKTYEYLRHKAIRICVNPVLEQALSEIPEVNGPLIHIPMGMDIRNFPESLPNQHDVVIAAFKAPRLGARLKARLRRHGRRVKLLTDQLPRADYLSMIASGRVAVLLPMRREGFYLPMLEAMAMRRIVVCPNCVGNLAFGIPNENAFIPEYTLQAIEFAVESALSLSPVESEIISRNAADTAASYTMERERDAFLNVLGNTKTLWNDGLDI